MNIKKQHQMSESMVIAILLTLAGGAQDAYSYLCRGHVFANAQTGNVVLLSISIAELDFSKALSYIIPISAFILGIYATERFHQLMKDNQVLHWRQIVLGIEILLLILVAFLPQSMNLIANVIMSFTSAMQMTCFRKFHGHAMATTVCTGNLRIATETLCRYHITKDRTLKYTCVKYYLSIIAFATGAAIGTILFTLFQSFAILTTVFLLISAFILMFMKEEFSALQPENFD